MSNIPTSRLVQATTFVILFGFAWLVYGTFGINRDQSDARDIGGIKQSSNELGEKNSGASSLTTQTRQLGLKDESIASHLPSNSGARQSEAEAYLAQQMATQPLGANGINEYAIRQNGITKKQSIAIASVVRELRLQMANTILNGLEDLEDPGDAQFGYKFSTSKEFADNSQEKLRSAIASIVNKEFADACVAGMNSLASYYMGGNYDIYFYFKPGTKSGNSDASPIRIEFREKNLNMRSFLMGEPEYISNILLLDFEKMNMK
jgi:hypothetical protein